jgi:CCR4-NOT transcription complex subunit 6
VLVEKKKMLLKSNFFYFISRNYKSIALCHEKIGVPKSTFFDHRKYSPMGQIPWQELIDNTELKRSTERKTVFVERKSAPNETEFSMLTYNILADSIRSTMENTLTTQIPYTLRNLFILDEIKKYDADIICLQEVEAQLYRQLFAPQLDILGYEGYFQVKVFDRDHFEATKEWSESRTDGCATFWKKDKFNLVRNTFMEIRQGLYSSNYIKFGYPNHFFMKQFLKFRNIITMVHLESVGGDELAKHQLIVANTHILANSSKRAVQLGQLYVSMCALHKFCNGLDYPVIFCGDLNIVPFSVPYKFLDQGVIKHTDASLKVSVDNEAKLVGVDVTSPFSLKSAYKTVLGREGNTLRYGIPSDYLWYNTTNIQPIAVDSYTQYDTKVAKYLDYNENYPSDHFPVYGKFVFKNNSQRPSPSDYAIPRLERKRKPVGRRTNPQQSNKTKNVLGEGDAEKQVEGVQNKMKEFADTLSPETKRRRERTKKQRDKKFSSSDDRS